MKTVITPPRPPHDGNIEFALDTVEVNDANLKTANLPLATLPGCAQGIGQG